MQLIEVAFKGNRKEFFAWEGEEPPPMRASVIVEADRGEDLGVVNATGELAQKRNDGCAHGCGSEMPTRKAMRVAGPRELAQARDVRAQDDQARRRAAERVKAHGLAIKLSDAEWQWDRKKLTLFFTADRRVDFRNLVRDLASVFRTRIELKQYGVRDEAKRLDGVGRCGRQFCSASWLPELRPVNLGVAKDQHLSLNPSQISGACGRLMCCLRYEHEFYVQSRKRFPKEGKLVATARGEEKVVANDIFNERVTLRAAEGETRVLTLTQLRLELAGGQPTDTATNGGSARSDADGELEAGGPGELGLSISVSDADADLEEDFDSNAIDADWPTFDAPRAAPEPPQPPRSRSSPTPSTASTPDTSALRQPPPPPPPPPSRPGTPSKGPRSGRTGGPGRSHASSGRGREGTPPSSSPSPSPSQGGETSPDSHRRRRGRRGGRRGRGGDNRRPSSGGDGSNGGGSAPPAPPATPPSTSGG